MTRQLDEFSIRQPKSNVSSLEETCISPSLISLGSDHLNVSSPNSAKTIIFCQDYTTKIPPFKFNGTSSTVEFIRELEDYFILHNIPENKKLSLTVPILVGRVKDWYQTIGRRQLETCIPSDSNFNNFKTLLLKSFPDTIDKMAVARELFNRRQQKYDNPHDFSLQTIKLYKLWNHNANDEEIINVLISQLLPEISDYIEIRSPSTLSEFWSILNNYVSRRGEEHFKNRWAKPFSQRNSSFHRSYQQSEQISRNFPQRRENIPQVNYPYRYSVRQENSPQKFWKDKANVAHFSNERQHTQNKETIPKEMRVNALNLSSPDLPNLVLSLDKIPIIAKLDTGSEKSFISHDFYRHYLIKKQIIPVTGLNVVSAQGNKCKVIGMIDLQITLKNEHFNFNFLIMHGMTFDCLLGLDFIHHTKLELDFNNMKLRLNKVPYNCANEKKSEISIQIESQGLSNDEKDNLNELIRNFQTIFSEKPGLTQIIIHSIDTGEAKPIASKPYRYDKVKTKIIEQHIEEMLSQGLIERKQSPWASPVVLIRKKNEYDIQDPRAWRFAVDYRKLNSLTKYSRHPLPVIEDLLANLSHTNYMSTLDLTSGYFQVAIHPDDVLKTAFIVNNEQYCFKRMAFGLSGAPSTFQYLMNTVLRPVLNKFCHVYLDDIIITSATFSDHLNHLATVFSLLDEAGLKLNISKCHFGLSQLKYLGYRITSSGIQTEQNKINPILNYPIPTTKKELARFLGMTSWYSQFIPFYAEICEPLYNLKRKNVKFKWSDLAHRSFEQLKKALTSAPVLQFPDYKKPYAIYCDASCKGLGAVLTQNGHPVAYASRILNKAEKNYTTTELECLAVIFALHKFRTYFTHLPITIVTDHSALTHLNTAKNLTPRLFRWTLKLQQFNIKIQHRPGSKNQLADALSRNPIEEPDSTEEVSLTPCLATTLILESREQLIEEQKKDNEFGPIYECLENHDSYLNNNSINIGIKNRSKDYEIIDKILFYRKDLNENFELRPVIPKTLRSSLLREFHDIPSSAHCGIRKTFNKLKNVAFWPEMRKIVTEYVKTCDTCQKINYPNQKPAGKMISTEVSFPFEKIGMDLLGPYPMSKLNRARYILVITDYFTKYIELIPLRNATAKIITKVLVENIFLRYGTPHSIVSDNGKQFSSKIFQNICQELQIKHITTVPYRPQSNLTERVNRNVVRAIRAYVTKCHTDWDRFLPHFAFAFNTATHDSSGYPPSQLFFGRQISTPWTRLVHISGNKENLISNNIQDILEEAKLNMKKAQERQRHYYNLRRRKTEFHIGQEILKQLHHLSCAAESFVAKFAPKFDGPFKIKDIKENNLIIVNSEGKIETINIDQAKPYHNREKSKILSHLFVADGASTKESEEKITINIPSKPELKNLLQRKRCQPISNESVISAKRRKISPSTEISNEKQTILNKMQDQINNSTTDSTVFSNIKARRKRPSKNSSSIEFPPLPEKASKTYQRFKKQKLLSAPVQTNEVLSSFIKILSEMQSIVTNCLTFKKPFRKKS